MTARKSIDPISPLTSSTVTGKRALGLLEIGKLHAEALDAAGFGSADRAELQRALTAFESEHDGFVRDRSRVANLSADVRSAVVAIAAFRTELYLGLGLLELK